jgi:hypothetical protein
VELPSFPASELCQPCFCLRFLHNSQYLYDLICDVIKDPDLANAEPELWLGDPTKSLNAAPAYLRGLVPQMSFDRCSYLGPDIRFEPLKIFDRFRGQEYLERHSGYNIARMSALVK